MEKIFFKNSIVFLKYVHFIERKDRSIIIYFSDEARLSSEYDTEQDAIKCFKDLKDSITAME